jgi:heme oxygenase
MAALRTATRPAHQRLERGIDVKQRFSSLVGYREHLGRLWGFYSGLERQLAPGFFGAALPDYESRRKLPLLARDLIALGEDPHGLPVCPGTPACTDRAIAFGCLYVLEGSTLGARVLLPIVATELELDAAHGAVYLESYGAGTTQRWADFGAALDAWCASPARRAAATQAAIESFGVLQDWLTQHTA